MAVKTTDNVQSFNSSSCRRAALLAIAQALAGTAGLIALIATAKGSLDAQLGAFVLAFVAMAVLAAGGVQLLRRRVGAYYLLTAMAVAAAVAATLVCIAALLDGVPTWWTATFSIALPWVAVPVLAMAILEVWLLVRAASATARLRFGSYVTISLGVAVLLLVVANMIAQTDYYRRDFEQLRWYGLSGTSKKILNDLKTPVTLTCVYTTGDERTSAIEYRQRVLDLMAEMHEYNPRIEVVNAVSDSDKARVMARLRSQHGNEASAHVALLTAFRDRQANRLIDGLKAQQPLWSKLPADAYLGLWAQTADIATALDKNIQSLEDLRRKIKGQLASSQLPDYVALTGELGASLDTIQQQFAKANGFLKQAGKIPAAAVANAKATQAAVDEFQAAVREMGKAAGPKTASMPADVSAVIGQYAQAAEKAAAKADAAADRIDQLAGAENAEAMTGFAGLTVAMGEDRATLGDFFRYIASQIRQEQGQATAALQVLKGEYLQNILTNIRKNNEQISQLCLLGNRALDSGLKELTKIDPASQKILDASKTGGFATVLATAREMLGEVAKLPQLKGKSLSMDLGGDNIVIVEARGKTPEVIGFDEVWPLRTQESPGKDKAEASRRIFNGDAAIASRILGMTTPPFGTVVLTYTSPPQQVMQMIRRTDMLSIPANMASLRKRLEGANFKVEEWDLNGAMPVSLALAADAQTATSRPASQRAQENPPMVLLVLPPSPLAPTTPQQFQQLRTLIDSPRKAMPAIFLGGFSPQGSPDMMTAPPPSPINEYLADSWGIDLRSDYRVMAGVPDESVTNRFHISLLEYSFMHLSSFTDQPIGKPLQGQRVLWFNVCPVQNTDRNVAGVTRWPLLEVPAWRREIWATARLSDLLEKMDSDQGGYVSPDYARGDLRPPFSVAMAAGRIADAARKRDSNRVVVLGVGQSLLDSYLNGPVPVLGEHGELRQSDPPPRTNADLVVNSAYWLIGQQRYIAAGPAQIKPVVVSDKTLTVLKIAVLGVCPALILAIGGLVMLSRRK